MSASVASRLGETLGGRWSYRAPCHWVCDDGIRRVVRCSAGVDEFDNPAGPPQVWLYGDGAPRRAEGYAYLPAVAPAAPFPYPPAPPGP